MNHLEYMKKKQDKTISEFEKSVKGSMFNGNEDKLRKAKKEFDEI